MVDDFKADMESIRQMYIRWKDRGLKSEDARFVLPNACTSEIVISANFRQFRHIFRLRCDKHAQWEIRAICRDMLFKLYNVAPSVFQDVLDKVVEQDRQVPDR
jgi:thymidylate synthase (FAD)